MLSRAVCRAWSPVRHRLKGREERREEERRGEERRGEDRTGQDRTGQEMRWTKSAAVTAAISIESTAMRLLCSHLVTVAGFCRACSKVAVVR